MLKKVKKLPAEKHLSAADAKREQVKKDLKEKDEIHLLKEQLPGDQKYWLFFKTKIEDFSQAYGFTSVNLPIVAPTAPFLKFNKSNADELKKDLAGYQLKGKNEDLCLRPDILPLLYDFYCNSKLRSVTLGKFFYHGAIFSKGDKGIVEERFKFIFESFGQEDPIVEAELIAMSYSIYSDLGQKIALRINNLGCKECQVSYWAELENYYKNRKRYICDDCKKLYSAKSMDFLNCQKENCKELTQDAPQLVDHLCDTCREDFVKVLELLDEAEVPYVLDSKMVFSPNKYYKTIFSIEPEDKGQNNPERFLIGGRHDKILALFGEKELTSIGFEGVVDDITLVLKRHNFVLPEFSEADVFVCHLGEKSVKKSLKLFEDLRKNNIKVAHAFHEDSLQRQLTLARKLKVRIVLILGQREVIDKTMLLRDLETGSQEVITQEAIIDEVKRRLSKSSVNNHYIDHEPAPDKENFLNLDDTEKEEGEFNSENGDEPAEGADKLYQEDLKLDI